MMCKGKVQKAFWRALLVAVIILTGCQPSVQPSAAPAPRFLTAALTPALDTLRPQMAQCADEEGHNLVVLASPVSAGVQPDLALRWGPEPGTAAGYSAVIGQEELVLAQNAENNITRMNFDTAQSLFNGRLGEYAVYNYPHGSDIQAVADSALKLEEAAPGRTHIAPDPAAMVEALKEDPRALGFLPRRWMTAELKPVDIEGIERGVLAWPIIAESASEPQGEARGWLLCLQDALSKEETP